MLMNEYAIEKLRELDEERLTQRWSSSAARPWKPWGHARASR